MIRWGYLIFFPNDDSLAYRILELTAISGELPASLLHSLSYSRDYIYNVISYLRKNNLLRVFHQDKLRGYRLTSHAKEILLLKNPDRFCPFLTGNVETNLLKSELNRRIRLHCIAEVNLLMLYGNVAVFPDKKPVVFTPQKMRLPPVCAPAFYTSREIKQIQMDGIKTNGSRMIGALLTPTGIHLTYNFRTGLIKIDHRSEQKANSLIMTALCIERLYEQYDPNQITGLMISKDFSVFSQILSSSETNTRAFFFLDGSMKHFYYLTSDQCGAVLLRLLCSEDKQQLLNRILRQDLLPPSIKYPIINDAFDRQGNPVLFGYFMDIPRINLFCYGLSSQQKHGTIICFDFQKQVLSDLYGSLVKIQSINLEKFERSFFPSKSENT